MGVASCVPASARTGRIATATSRTRMRPFCCVVMVSLEAEVLLLPPGTVATD